ncbi:kinase-like protein [Cenococcum geophilum 1.58]|uniref:kinase-like protein n=1 Tax=Cenococcum geophilum 1.58 TaxID=794803 RepID=UPI00358ED95F|nr:kinase-like protein [Cenococcum geophilum 1.58]
MFLERCVMDSALPLSEAKLSEMIPESASHFQKLQWEYIPFKFREHFHSALEPQRILPFIHDKQFSSGGFSTVYKVTMHSLYQNWDHSRKAQGVDLIRKEISQSISAEAQKREYDLLFLLRSLRNENIVCLLASYTQRGFCNLLFQPAESDLHDLLLNISPPEWFRDTKTVNDSVRGLANGLHYLHNFRPLAVNGKEADEIIRHGYHHDIKPRNILVRGKLLVLADFGLSRLRDAGEDTKTKWKNTFPTYGAPESHDLVTLEELYISRAFDIWSLGCVMSEIATFVLEGISGVKAFREQRQLDGLYGRHNCFHHEGSLSPRVVSWLQTMEERHSIDYSAGLFPISSDLLIADPNKRPKSAEVVRILDQITIRQWLHTIIDLLEHLMAPQDHANLSTVYLARTALESNRLRAWGYTLGVHSVQGQTKPYDMQGSKMYKEILALLSACKSELVTLQSSSGEVESRQVVLSCLTTTNNSLLKCLSESTKKCIDNAFHLLTVEAKESQILSNFDRNTTPLQGSSQHQEASMLAAARYMSILLSAQLSQPGTLGVNIIDPALISLTETVPIKPNPLSIRWYHQGYRQDDKKKILVEQRSYDNVWMNNTNDEEFAARGKEIFNRVQELAMLLQMKPKPKDMRVLDCLGVYHEPEKRRFGLLYDYPGVEQHCEDLEPITLFDVIRNTKEPEVNPTLNQKFALSLAITCCIHSIHLAGWLHKSVSSFNIVFFKEPGQHYNKIRISDPFLVGFQYSRQDHSEAYSTGPLSQSGHRIFVHPAYQIPGARFHPLFDYYSLGVTLLEIALWRTVDKMVDSRLQLHDREKLLIRTAENYIPQRMGTGYCDAVITCLRFYTRNAGTDETEQRREDRLLEFQVQVLEKLQKSCLPL